MMRREFFRDGRLIKEIDQIDVSTGPESRQFTDGRHRWLLDGEEVTPDEAERFRAASESE